MFIYTYIQAITSIPVQGPGDIAFRSTYVVAADEDDAYLFGQRWADQFEYHPEKEIINDYVVKIGSLFKE